MYPKYLQPNPSTPSHNPIPSTPPLNPTHITPSPHPIPSTTFPQPHPHNPTPTTPPLKPLPLFIVPQAPEGYKVVMNFVDDFGIYCHNEYQCYHWLEVRHSKDLGNQGPRLVARTRIPHISRIPAPLLPTSTQLRTGIPAQPHHTPHTTARIPALTLHTANYTQLHIPVPHRCMEYDGVGWVGWGGAEVKVVVNNYL